MIVEETAQETIALVAEYELASKKHGMWKFASDFETKASELYDYFWSQSSPRFSMEAQVLSEATIFDEVIRHLLFQLSDFLRTLEQR